MCTWGAEQEKDLGGGIGLGENLAEVTVATKTHKAIPDTGIPKSRIIMDGGNCSTANLGNSLTNLLEACVKAGEFDGESISTQQMLQLIEKVNVRIQI